MSVIFQDHPALAAAREAMACIADADGAAPARFAIEQLMLLLEQAAGAMVDGDKLRDTMVDMLDAVAVIVLGPTEGGKRHNLGGLVEAVADLAQRAPVSRLVVPGRLNGHDINATTRVGHLARAVVNRDRAIERLEAGLRAACAQRDAYREQLNARAASPDGAA